MELTHADADTEGDWTEVAAVRMSRHVLRCAELYGAEKQWQGCVSCLAAALYPFVIFSINGMYIVTCSSCCSIAVITRRDGNTFHQKILFFHVWLKDGLFCFKLS